MSRSPQGLSNFPGPNPLASPRPARIFPSPVRVCRVGKLSDAEDDAAYERIRLSLMFRGRFRKYKRLKKRLWNNVRAVYSGAALSSRGFFDQIGVDVASLWKFRKFSIGRWLPNVLSLFDPSTTRAATLPDDRYRGRQCY